MNRVPSLSKWRLLIRRGIGGVLKKARLVFLFVCFLTIHFIY